MDKKDDANLKIADFGFAKKHDAGSELLKTQCGTPGCEITRHEMRCDESRGGVRGEVWHHRDDIRRILQGLYYKTCFLTLDEVLKSFLYAVALPVRPFSVGEI